MNNPISIKVKKLNLARLTISLSSQYAGEPVFYMQATHPRNILQLRHDHHSEMHTTNSALIAMGVTRLILGKVEALNHLLHDHN